ncbi:hypothetical protein HOY80DRAFT_1104625 [Tuber brumale]|nr:hypothetical protein HOY80DRAFT_1104625 [Tuber brumale]
MPRQTFSQVSTARKQNLLVELSPPPTLPLPQYTLTNFHSTSLKHTSPPGVYASLSSTSHTTWHCVLFPRRGPYSSAVLPFTIEFPEWYPDGPPRIEFSSDTWHPMLKHGLFQWGSWWTRREWRGTVEVLEFVKSCFDDEAVVVKEVGGWKAGWEEKVRMVVQASHAKKGDGVSFAVVGCGNYGYLKGRDKSLHSLSQPHDPFSCALPMIRQDVAHSPTHLAQPSQNHKPPTPAFYMAFTKMYNYDPTPPISPLRHPPSLPIISTPSHIRRSDTITPTGRPFIEDDSDITPRPLRIKKVKKSPPMPFRKKGGGCQEGKEKDKESKRGFLGMNFPPSPRARSSSAGVLGMGKDKGKPGRDGDINDAHIHTCGKGLGSSPGAAKMIWLQRPTARQMASIPNHDEGIDSYHRENFPPMEHNRSEGYESRDSTSRVGEYACLLPYSSDRLADDKHRKNAFLRRASSTGAKYDKTARQRLEQRRLGPVNRVLEESVPPKSPPRGWRQMAMDLFQGNNGNSGQAVVKRADSRKSDRSNSISSTKSALTLTTPPEVSPIESNTTGDAEKKRVGRGLPRNSTAGSMWKLGGPDGSGHSSREGRSILSGGGVRNASVLAILDGKIGGGDGTRPQKCGQWKPPMLTVDLAVTPERDTLPMHSGRSRGSNGFWISVEIEGKVSSSAGYAGQPQGVGMDVGVLMDLSPYTSRTSFSSMKSKAKQIVESMESARDRVAVMTFPCATPNSVYTLNASGSVARQQLLKDIMSLSLPQAFIPQSSRNVQEAVMAAVRKLKAMPSDTTRYPRADRSVHLFLLTSQLDDGAIDLLPEVLMGQVQIHILGIGPVFWPKNEMGSSGWCVPLSTIGPRPGSKDGRSEQKPITVEEIVSTLRTAVDLGEAQNVVVHLRRAGDSQILEVIGDTEYPRLVPGEKRSLLIKVDPGEPINLTTCHDDASNPTDDWSFVEQQINSIQADLGVYETPLLTVKLTYQHSHHHPTTTLSIAKTAKVHRYNEHSHWRSSPALQTELFASPENSPKRPITHEEYVYRVRSQKAASMHSNPDRALSEIQAICASVRRAEVRVDLHDISRELSYRARTEKRFSQPATASTGDGRVERVPTGRSGRRNSSFSSDTTSEVLTYWRDGKLLSSPFLSLPDEAPLVRLGLEESDADGEGEPEEGMDEARKIWRDMKVKKYGSGGFGGTGRVRFSVNASGNGNCNGAGGKSPATLRDVRETDFGPWRV